MLDEKDEKRIKIIDELTKAVVESIVSTPMNNIRKASEQGNPEVVDLASKLFLTIKNKNILTKIIFYQKRISICHFLLDA